MYTNNPSVQDEQTTTALWRLILATILTGMAAGLVGGLLSLLLHAVQHIAYGYSLYDVLSSESFLQGVSAAPPWRRFAVLLLAGLLAGTGWWLLYRYGRTLLSVREAMEQPQRRMPLWESTVHAVLQIVTVGMGSPLGREAAPREMGAMAAGRLAIYLGLTRSQERVLMACGAGAGLAAVYNVPLAGTLFTLEVLLGGWRAGWVIPALATNAIATQVSQLVLGNEYQYHLPAYTVTHNLVLWALLCGPLFGAAATLFVRVTTTLRLRAPSDRRLISANLLGFLLLAMLSLWLPELPGNGKGPTLLGLNGELGIGMALLLLSGKVAVQCAVLRAGSQGGLITPGLANGALLACILGIIWSHFFPGTALGAFAIVGSAAFLAASMSMPLTALVLVLEFTHISHDFLLPMILAIAGAYAVRILFPGKTA